MNELVLKTEGDTHIIVTRKFAAPPEAVYRAHLEPELLQHGPAYVLYALMDTVVDRYFPVLDALTVEIEAVEERIFTGQTTRAQIEALYSLRRKLTVFDHAGVPLLGGKSTQVHVIDVASKVDWSSEVDFHSRSIASRLTKKSFVNVSGRFVKTPCADFAMFVPNTRSPPTNTVISGAVNVSSCARSTLPEIA